jgi:hypothetical protein
MDQDLCAYQWVWATAGTESALFRVAPKTLRMLSNAVVAPVADVPWMRAPTASSFGSRLSFEAGTGA